jgi:hypothetical protein
MMITCLLGCADVDDVAAVVVPPAGAAPNAKLTPEDNGAVSLVFLAAVGTG